MMELARELYDYEDTYKIKASGALVLVNTDEHKIHIDPITSNVILDFAIANCIVDICDRWNYIHARLLDIYKMYIKRFDVK